MVRAAFRALVALLAAASLASCGGKSATTTAPATVVGSPAEEVTFAEVENAIARLYRRRPGIRTFVVRDVEYNTATRDKVLDICHRGGLELNRAALESSRIAGCAPLIFFFFNYGRQRHAVDSVAVARKIYWYAVGSIRGPFDARATLDALLRTWAVG
jgi:predicted small lipoprotein YifL